MARSRGTGTQGNAVRTAIWLVLVLSLLAGCTQDQQAENETSTTAGIETPDTTAQDATTTSVLSGQPTDQTIRLRVASDLVNWDPASNTGVDLPWSPQVYETLLRFDDNLEVVPVLAESYVVAEDLTSIALTIRSGVEFHNGEPLTAQAVADYLNLVRDPEAGGALATGLSIIADVEALEDNQLRITFNQPAPELRILSLMTVPRIGWAENQANVDNTAVGTGPFTQGMREPGQSFTLVRNDNYWGELALAAEIEFVVISDGSTATAALQSGEVDGAYDLPFSAQAQLGEDYPLVVNPSAPGTLVIGLNAAFPPFDRAEVRHAFTYAMNRDVMVQSVYLGQSSSKILPWPESSPAFDSEVAAAWGYDPERARQMFADAGITSLPDPILAPAELTQMSGVAEIIQGTLAEIGVQVEVETPDLAGFLDVLLGGESAIAVFGVGGENLHPSSFLSNGFTDIEGNLLWPGGGPPDAYVEAVELARSALTPDEESEAFAALNDAYMEKATLIPLVGNPLLFNASPRLVGVEQDTTSAWFRLHLAHLVD